MYGARQETRRAEIERRAADVLVGSLARCLDDAHAKTQSLPEAKEIEETAWVRARARQLLADVVPPVSALLGQLNRSAEIRHDG